MAKESVYVLQDVKAGGFTTPVVAVNDAMVCRVFGRLLVTDPQSLVALYPQDYLILHIGYYDGSTGKLEALPDVRMLSNLGDIAVAVRKAVENG